MKFKITMTSILRALLKQVNVSEPMSNVSKEIEMLIIKRNYKRKKWFKKISNYCKINEEYFL